MPSTSFDPAVHGFHFANRFVNTIARLPNGAKIRTNGRCGGMAYAALDIHGSGRVAPPARGVDFPKGVPPDGTPLADYLYLRLLDSFLEPSAVRFLAWTLLPDEPSVLFKGVTGWTAEQIGLLCRAIDAGTPVPLGLVGARHISDVGRRNHQVVAHAYDRSRAGVLIGVYDPNTPDRSVTLSWVKGTAEIRASNRALPWRGLFVHTYEPRTPPAALWRRIPASRSPVSRGSGAGR